MGGGAGEEAAAASGGAGGGSSSAPPAAPRAPPLPRAAAMNALTLQLSPPGLEPAFWDEYGTAALAASDRVALMISIANM